MTDSMTSDFMTQRLEQLQADAADAYKTAFAASDFSDATCQRISDIEQQIDLTRGWLFAGRTWTADGDAADRTGWCECGTSDASDDVEYIVYAPTGTRQRHGLVCSKCRKITQTG